MGALLAFQSRSGDGATAFEQARRHLVEQKALAPRGEAPGAVKFARRNGSGMELARSERGWLMAAGQLDHPELAVDDAAGLLARLEAHGETELDRLDGFFALIWADGDTWTVQTDAFGRLHLYTAVTGEGVYLATSSIALAHAGGAAPDPEAVWEFLATGTMYEDRTPFRGVRRLAGARRYRVAGGAIDAGRPTDAYFLPPHGGSRDGDVGTLFDEATAITRRWVPEDSRPLPDLTGGLDSRLVVGCMLEAGHRPDVTCTGEPGDGDIDAAHRLARALDLTFLREPRAPGIAAQRAFERVVEAALWAEGEYDAAEYAAIAAIHVPHSGAFGCSVNGSGGEVFRNYWWDRRHLEQRGEGAVDLLVRRFTHNAQAPAFLAARDPAAHFRAALERTLAARPGGIWPDLGDDAYLMLRMQCWQGAIASATNEIWPTISPLMSRRVLAALYRVPYEQRLDNHLVYDLLARFPTPFTRIPLATGFPPARVRATHAWRFLPGLLGLPGRLWPRVKARLGWTPPDPTAAETVRAIMAGGGADLLAPGSLKLGAVVDAAAYRTFYEAARTTGSVPLSALGRLLSLEVALRASDG
ncbi:MAG: hypothetical protein OER88_04140 [Planctomycetota bacterium]|nr:hypothetical protein [Planctomycetota bacterium]